VQENDEQSSGISPQYDPMRVLALTDGVFAIIMTILVLELHVPVVSTNEELKTWGVALSYKLLLYFASFLLAGVYWVGHRSLFSLVRRVNTGLLWINIIFLMIAALIPVGASLLGQYPRMPLALRAYGVLLFLLAAWRLVMYLYVTSRHDLLIRTVSPRVKKRVIAVMIFAPTLFLISTILSPYFPKFSLILYVITPPMFITMITLVNRTERAHTG
jgi:uncharacterized membrane protein